MKVLFHRTVKEIGNRTLSVITTMKAPMAQRDGGGWVPILTPEGKPGESLLFRWMPDWVRGQKFVREHFQALVLVASMDWETNQQKLQVCVQRFVSKKQKMVESKHRLTSGRGSTHGELPDGALDWEKVSAPLLVRAAFKDYHEDSGVVPQRRFKEVAVEMRNLLIASGTEPP